MNYDPLRRRDVKRQFPAERAIYTAVRLVEEMGADARLTDAVLSLQEAAERVADYIDGTDRARQGR